MISVGILYCPVGTLLRLQMGYFQAEGLKPGNNWAETGVNSGEIRQKAAWQAQQAPSASGCKFSLLHDTNTNTRDLLFITFRIISIIDSLREAESFFLLVFDIGRLLLVPKGFSGRLDNSNGKI